MAAVFSAFPLASLFAEPPATAPALDAPVEMDFPADGMELKTLVDIVTKQLRIPILYDEQLSNKKVVIRVPMNVPQSALLGMLQSALRMKGMALVDSEQPGWKQIVVAQNLAAVAKPLQQGVAAEPGEAVTQVFAFTHADPARLAEAIRPFLTVPGGNIQTVGGQRELIVSDYPSVIRRIEQIAKTLDTEAAAVSVQFVSIKQADATAVASTVMQLLTSKETFQGGTTPGVFLAPDDRTNQIAVISPAARLHEVMDLIAGLDKPVDVQTKVYRLKTLEPERLDRLMKNLLGNASKRTYQATADREAQLLVVAATSEVHGRIDAMLKDLDAPLSQTTSPIKFYKLKNTKAADVLATIAGLYGEGGLENFQAEAGDSGQAPAGGTQPRAAGATAAPLAPSPNNAATAIPMNTNIAGNTNGPNGGAGNLPLPRNLTSLQRPLGDTTGFGDSSMSRYGYDTSRAVSGNLLGDAPASPMSVRSKNATVTADVNSNSVIVIAAPGVQAQYADLIKRLDERRPQVQIECTIVTLDTSDSFTLGVDIGRAGGAGKNSLISFSSFGVSIVNPKTGALTPTQGTGGTFALLSPNIADVVIRALQQNSHARLVSAPQILVNDNGKGRLQSVAQQPFAEILDTASSQTRTGLGGQAEAGTTITVEPHISEEEYLQLAYSIELSNFTGAGRNGLPPPSQKNTVDSAVTIPDGYTIVVGGLAVKNFTAAVDAVPLLGDIPVLNLLFGTRNRSNQDTTLFVFLRPVILRDDKFADLKYLSERKVHEAGLPGDYPISNPIPLR